VIILGITIALSLLLGALLRDDAATGCPTFAIGHHTSDNEWLEYCNDEQARQILCLTYARAVAMQSSFEVFWLPTWHRPAFRKSYHLRLVHREPDN
jgi:hypothetical protein